MEGVRFCSAQEFSIGDESKEQKRSLAIDTVTPPNLTPSLVKL
jgi:hypothetical protein